MIGIGDRDRQWDAEHRGASTKETPCALRFDSALRLSHSKLSAIGDPLYIVCFRQGCISSWPGSGCYTAAPFVSLPPSPRGRGGLDLGGSPPLLSLPPPSTGLL